MTETESEFIKSLEGKLGEKIKYRTFSVWYGSTDGTLREYGVFFASLSSSFYIEDFDRKPQILGIEIHDKKREKYVQYSRQVQFSEIKNVKRVSESRAKKAVTYKENGIPIPESGALSKVFQKNVTAVTLNSGETMFFEVIDDKAFRRALSGA